MGGAARRAGADTARPQRAIPLREVGRVLTEMGKALVVEPFYTNYSAFATMAGSFVTAATGAGFGAE